jgi:hypothetical protein
MSSQDFSRIRMIMADVYQGGEILTPAAAS